MFEGWLGDIITRFVGYFLDVKKEQLRVSLWSGKLLIVAHVTLNNNCITFLYQLIIDLWVNFTMVSEDADSTCITICLNAYERLQLRQIGFHFNIQAFLNHAILHSGWSTSLVLENVRLKVEAFEYLQLPFNLREGCIGRLEIQVNT